MLDFNAAPDSTCSELEKLQPFVCPSTLRRTHACVPVLSRESLLSALLFSLFKLKKKGKDWTVLLGFRLPAATVELQRLQHTNPQTRARSPLHTRTHAEHLRCKKADSRGKELDICFPNHLRHPPLCLRSTRRIAEPDKGTIYSPAPICPSAFPSNHTLIIPSVVVLPFKSTSVHWFG